MTELVQGSMCANILENENEEEDNDEEGFRLFTEVDKCKTSNNSNVFRSFLVGISYL